MAVDKLVDSTQLDADLTSVANAIRTKGGTSASLAFPADFVIAIAALPTGGADLDAYFKRTAPTSAVLPTATRLCGYAFFESAVLQSINAPSVTRIGQRDFGSCTALTSVYFPELLYAADLTTADSAITKDSACRAFEYCSSLGTINFPKLTKCGSEMFWYAGNNAKTAIIVLPSILYVSTRMFRSAKLDVVDIGANCEKIWSDGFYNGSFNKVILRRSTVVEAASRDAVRYITTLYVPQALVASYSTATNWVTDAASRTVLPIEGSIYENAYADGTPIS